MLATRTAAAARPAAAASRARCVRVSAVAKPTGKQRAAGSQHKSAGKPSSGDKGDADAKRKRSSQYTTWQAMAQHASNPSATPSGFDESMM